MQRLSIYNLATDQPAGAVARHDVHEGGLARPRGSHDGGQLARLELARHTLKSSGNCLLKDILEKRVGIFFPFRALHQQSICPVTRILPVILSGLQDFNWRCFTIRACQLWSRCTREINSTILRILVFFYMYCILILTDGQVRLLRLVHLQKDNFRLILRKLTDKRQISVCTTSKR